MIRTKETFYIRKGFNSHRICFEHQHGRNEVVWKRPLVCRDTALLSNGPDKQESTNREEHVGIAQKY